MIDVIWDQEAAVWIATSRDVPGLCAQAATREELTKVVKALVPEMLGTAREAHIEFRDQKAP